MESIYSSEMPIFWPSEVLSHEFVYISKKDIVPTYKNTCFSSIID